MVEKLTLSWRRAASPGKRYLGILPRGTLRVLQGFAIGDDERPDEIRVHVVALSRGASRSSRCVRIEPGVLAFSQARCSTPLTLFRDARRGTLSLTAADHRCEDAGSRKCEKRLVIQERPRRQITSRQSDTFSMSRMDIDVHIVRMHTIQYTAVT